MWYNNILETIGNTPMVKMNKTVEGIPGTILAKVETFNPGNSIKDRMAVQMVEDAEKEGLLKPGGTIIEATSGNTGMGLALAAIVKGYRLICTMPDKQSKEKIDILRAVGSEVIVTPTNVEADDPRSYYSVARKLNEDIPNSFYPNQYDNPSNPKAHYATTGPEIWEQTDGKITHLVVGVGTGGTVSGTAKFLKEKNPNIKVWGVDTYGSIFKKFHETGEFDKDEIYSYLTEGIGEDILPKNVDFSLIDHFEKVTDKDGMLMTRRLAREEGLFLGNSAGSAISAIHQLKQKLTKDDIVVVIMHDSGSRYVGKIFNDDWMRQRGFLDREKAIEILNGKDTKFISINKNATIGEAAEKMTHNNVSQLPVMHKGRMIGSISDKDLFNSILHQPDCKGHSINGIMRAPFPEVDANTSTEELAQIIGNESSAVVVAQKNGSLGIITRHDIISALSK
jgi:cystathionine beta-synthase